MLKGNLTKQKVWILGGLLTSLVLFSGCPLFLLGAGAAGGYAVSKDQIEGILEKKLDSVYKASRETLMYEGFIRSEDKPHGTIEGEVKKSIVNIEVNQMSERTVRLRVKARKAAKLLPDIELANELYNKIIKKL